MLTLLLAFAAGVIGFAILSGQDKSFEAAVLAHAPDWLIQLTTRF